MLKKQKRGYVRRASLRQEDVAPTTPRLFIMLPFRPADVNKLGRDIIDRWRMVYDRTDGVLEFTVRSADAILDV